VSDATASSGATVSASAPTDVAVTVYRNPYGHSTSLDLDGLGGFALVTETRSIVLPAGETRLRFEGVADGIQSQSAIITGLPSGVLEKNHDAKVLSPAALVQSTLGRKLWLVRTDAKTGHSSTVQGKLVADTNGVVFQGPEGIEALRCSGLPETFQFEGEAGADATPTLSALVRSPTPLSAQVRLSYLTAGFDWMANYSATVSADGKTFDLGAWVTLANSNGVSFPNAHAQVVAGRLNRESGEVEPLDSGEEILAQCWPRGSTSDTPEEPQVEGASPLEGGPNMILVTAMRAPAPMARNAMDVLQEAVVSKVEQEQLGDLKLYRVPERTSVISRQIKQVRLMDRRGVPAELIYEADVTVQMESADSESVAFHKVLRTRNDKEHHLGLPLPSGQMAAFYERHGVPLLVSEAPLRDVAENEELEIELGEAPDAQLSFSVEERHLDLSTLKKLPLVPHVHIRSDEESQVARIDVSNARNTPILAEIGLELPDGMQVVRADHSLTKRNGRPTFRVEVPAQESMRIRFELGRTVERAVIE
jgi:hypothetical protein